MIVTAMQPGYLPWLGFFERIKMADVYVMSDDVPMDGGGVVNRNKVKAPGGDGWMWLTVPVRHSSGVPIKSVEIADDVRWQMKHCRTLEQSYGALPAFWWEVYYESEWRFLSDLLDVTLGWFFVMLDVVTPVVRASELDVDGRKTERLVNICRAAGADTYLSGPRGREYLELEQFKAWGIDVQFHDYVPVGAGLSALDYVLTEGVR
jgi:hypothetical protein